MNHYTPSLSRTSSTTSISSDDAAATSPLNLTRRRRKRFTNVQLTMLEHLFHQNSHPSRLDREAVAKSGAMEIKSVTIWFQNKRQTERKVALQNTTSITGTTVGGSNTSTGSRTPTKSPLTPTPTASPSIRPSLDHVASRSELRTHTQRTPTRRHDPHASIWDNMPSSPPAPASPPPPEYFPPAHCNRRTLEWACAAARRLDKAESTARRRARAQQQQQQYPVVEAMDDSEPDTLVMHAPSRSRDDKAPNPDEDIMKAALALCGLGRR